MRLKTLGVVFVSVLALFTVFYWLTDGARLEAHEDRQAADLLHFGEENFGPPTEENPAAANCASCHGADGRGGQVGDTGREAPSLHTQRIADRLAVNPLYVELVIRYGGVVASGDINSPMPAWSTEAGGGLNREQIDALTVLVESWALAAAAGGDEEAVAVEDTAEAGQQVYNQPGTGTPCSACHGTNLEGGVGPSLQTIGATLSEELPTPVSQNEKRVSDYEEDPREYLRLWIRDSAANYNDGEATGMPAFPEDQLPDDALEALITFLLEQTE